MRAPYWPLEFRIRQPAWHCRLIGHRQRDSQRHPHLLRHPRVAERRAVLVAGLVVALAVIARGLLLAPADGPTDRTSRARRAREPPPAIRRGLPHRIPRRGSTGRRPARRCPALPRGRWLRRD